MRSVEVHVPVDENAWHQLRSQDLTSTEIASLFGCSPYLTYFELWHRKHAGLVVQSEDNVRSVWGNRLQDSIANGIAQDQGWEIRRMSEYIRDPKLRWGSSFDYAIGGDAHLEVKNVDALIFRDGWIVDGDNIEAPAHIELQVQNQLGVSGRKKNYIGALVGGNRIVLIEREADDKIISAIKTKVQEFWDSVWSHKEPKPDFIRDAEFISKLYRQSTEGKIIDVKQDAEIFGLCQEYRRLSEVEKEAKQGRDAIKAQLLMKIGDAEKCLGDGFSITAGTVKPCEIAAYTRESYRNFRVNWAKVKENK